MVKEQRLGKLKPLHKFFLNPYDDMRFTRCPGCERKTKIRKKPFLIHIDPQYLLVLNMSGPYCPDCDLMILHRVQLETLLVMTFEQHNPAIIGNDYLVLGTVERSYWREKVKGQADDRAIFDQLHDFKEYVQYEVIPPHWGPDKET